jgi:hypothetical protein
MTRDRILKALVLLIVGAALGAGVGGTLMAHVVSSLAEDEAAERAYTARCLFRVAERHLGHDRLIVEWREEIKAMQPGREPDTAEVQP